jgi:hypothetical protein
MVAVWPPEESDEEPFFYLERLQGMPIRTVSQARSDVPSLGVVPILTPIDHDEKLLNDNYVASNISGRLSSRHFRNQLRLMKARGELVAFLDFARPWLDGLELQEFRQHLEPEGLILDIFYSEPGSRVPKELVWAGDGIQVWLQLLYHIYRVRSMPTLVLDEPEVYLHPDLQRRLVHLLESTGRQIVLATHSSEMAAEADPKLVILIERTRRRAQRARDEATLERLSAALGTAFNLRLARALRSKVVLFVEGQDMAILRRLAKTLDLPAIASERGVAVISLEGYTKWGQVGPFAWLCSELLPDTLKTFVVLDHDYRTEANARDVEAAFRQEGIEAHIWKRKELESYLLTVSVIARLSHAPVSVVQDMLDKVTAGMESEVFGRMLDERQREEVSGSRHLVNVATDFKAEFAQLWQNVDFRLYSCPAKQVIARMNDHLRDAGYKPVSARSLAASHRRDEIPGELAVVLRRVESALASFDLDQLTR